MITPEYAELIKQLHSRTAKGEVNWRPTSDKNEFVIYFDEFSLSLRYGFEEQEPDYIVFVLRNQAGSELDRFWVEEPDPEWSMVNDLYSGARRKALKIDYAVGALLKELMTNEIIGHDKLPKQ